MDTIKTAIVVVFLLAVLYGVYVVLNKPPQDVGVDLGWAPSNDLQPPQIHLDNTELVEGQAQPPAAPPLGGMAADSGQPGPAMRADAPPPPFTPDQPGPPEIPAPHLQPAARPELAGESVYGPPPGESYGRSQYVAVPGAGPSPAPPTTDLARSAPPLLSAPPTESPQHRQRTSEAETDSYYARSAPTGGAGVEPAAFVPPADPVGTDPSADQSELEQIPLPGDPPPLRSDSPDVSPEAAESADDAVSTAVAGSSAEPEGYDAILETGRSLIEQGRYREALATLTPLSLDLSLDDKQRNDALDLLDPLAGKVVYSREHLLAEPHVASGRETLFEIAQRHNVPWQLLKNINGVRSPRALKPQAELKVVPGPFRAVIDLPSGELTLLVGELYAGRFQVRVGDDPPPQPGSYKVRGKQEGHVYFGADGSTVPRDDPQNPYGAVWLDLGGGVCLHGRAEAEPAVSGGCLGLSEIDAADVFGILSIGSAVEIR